ncbi:drug/metabolite transporter (DMT)-like permease [Azospirillum fermentarium]|uniref:DMT family transporter n=1 Tax=Azospirillum fermentarium TaxID=1233114 RepID=UPI002225DAC5|nr:DMT family transporter [Azospirillum fermentarium]MCW2244722.1 drug/metabolite transporter (DMT)-like permease [Azospirillum fermentarium]
MAGIAWMMAATLVFVTQDATSRVLLHAYPVAEVAWARFTIHTVLAAAVVLVRSPALLRANRPGWQVVRSLLLFGVSMLMMVALQLMPFMDIAAIVAVTPVLVTALSVPLLGETVGWRRWLGVLVGLAGAMMVAGPASTAFRWAVAVPLLIALTNALYQIVTRKLGPEDHPLTTSVYTALVGAVGTTLFLPLAWVTPDAAGWALMLVLGLAGTLSHYCMIRAYTAATASVVAPFGYMTLVWAAGYSLLLFAEIPGTMTIAGSLVIAASGLYILYRERTVKGVE